MEHNTWTGGSAPQPAEISADARRVALDGRAYTYPQYVQAYGNSAVCFWAMRTTATAICTYKAASITSLASPGTSSMPPKMAVVLVVAEMVGGNSMIFRGNGDYEDDLALAASPCVNGP